MRVYNFSAGPACLPEEILKKAQQELFCYKESGMSVLEMSHRSADFDNIIIKAESDLRKLMSIPEDYKVLFLQGGASLQFSMVPLNLMSTYQQAYYINTGVWSKKAIAEAQKTGKTIIAASSEDKTFSYIPEINAGMFNEGADYVHITHNNTIYGTRFLETPQTGNIPLVADMSSSILSEEINIRDYGLIYAGAQKNIGPAGVTIVIIRQDLIGKAPDDVPTMLNYQTHAENGSMFNTPPTFGIYIAGLVFEYLLKNGGIPAMQRLNEKKAAVLYDYLDSSSLFSGTVNKKDRSLMNVPFITGDEAKDKQFIATAKQQGIVNIKGHRSVGGMRASIYNAMPIKGVQKLVDVMKEFERKA
ncbi:MAG: 3-phosphoserine/phosphohydroxythreonine transaminase [Christensenellales bacterium]|jgi:phosphoserine aminotransferase